MEFIQSQSFLYLLAWFTTMGGIWLLFDRAEIVLHEDVRKQLTAWLKKDKSFDSKKWPALFISIFDRIFGERHFTLKCFFRSCVSSIFIMLIITLIFFSIGSFNSMIQYLESFDNFLSLLTDSEKLKNTKDFSYTFTIFFIILSKGFIINLIPDYLSLLETRIILNLLPNSSLIKKIFLLFLDFIFTTLISITSIIGYFVIFSSIPFSEITFDYSVLFDESLFLINKFIFVWIITSYFTSIWLWLFILSSFFIQSFRVLLKGLSFLPKVFNIEENPLRTMGFVCMILITLLFVLIPIF